MNTVDASTNAYLQRTDARIADNLTVSARTPAQIFSIGASVSVSTGNGKANLAGQASYNNISNETRAFINDATVNGPASSGAKPTVVLRAVDDSYILAVAGAVAYGGKAGIGASVSINTVGNVTEAFIRNSHVSAASVAALAESGTRITSVTAAIGGSTGLMAAEAAVSVNVVSNTTTAYISGRKNGQGLVSAGGMSLIATDASAITADAGAVSVRGGSGSGGSLGAGVAVNDINNSVKASIDDATVSASNVNVAATGLAVVQTLSIGGAVTAGTAGGTSVSMGPLSRTIRWTIPSKRLSPETAT